MTTNKEYTQEFIEIIASLDGDIPGRRAAQSYMQNSCAIVHGSAVPSSYIPRFFNQRTYDTFKYVAETTHTITTKIIEHYLEDESYRTLFDYEPRLKELILIPRRYPEVLPLARLDVFLNEDNYTCGFCELNADGSSGLNEDREHNASFAQSSAFHEFASRHKLASSELFASWVEEFIKIYSHFENKVDNPQIAIVDFLDQGAITAEFQTYCSYFKAAGFPCFMADARSLNYSDGYLRNAEGKRIDAIFRRCVTNDILKYWDESQALIEAVREGKAALIGSFVGHIAHDKQIFDLMHHECTKQFLSEEEIRLVEACVPQTKFLNQDTVDIEDVLLNKDAWIIKPPDQYGAANVYAGKSYSEHEWSKIVESYRDGKMGAPYIVQRYLEPFQTEFLLPNRNLLELNDADIDQNTVLLNNLSGLYLFNGVFSGVFSRMGEKAIISEQIGSRFSAATIWTDCAIQGNMKEIDFG